MISATQVTAQQKPTVSFVTPTEGIFYASFIDTYVRVQAQDADGIASVRLFLNNQLVRQDNSAPYEWGAIGQNDLLLEDLLPGDYTLRAEATDNSGATASEEITFSIGEASLPQLPPLVSFVTPEPFIFYSGGTDFYVQVKAEIDPNSFSKDKVTSVRLFLDGQLVRQENIVPYEWGAADQNDPLLQDLAPGDYTLRAVATNAAGQQSSQELTLWVGEASLPIPAPLVSFITPQDGDDVAAGSDLLVEVEAQEDPNAGVREAIRNVRLFLNGQLVRQENIFPYQWGAPGQNDPLLTNLSPGEYHLRAVATNEGGRTGSAEIGIVVDASGQARQASVNPAKHSLDNSLDNSQSPVLFPNPAQNYDQLYIRGLSGEVTQLEVLDGLGRILHRQRVEAASSDVALPRLSPGIYYVRINDGQRANTRSLVIK